MPFGHAYCIVQFWLSSVEAGTPYGVITASPRKTWTIFVSRRLHTSFMGSRSLPKVACGPVCCVGALTIWTGLLHHPRQRPLNLRCSWKGIFRPQLGVLVRRSILGVHRGDS